MVEHDHAISDLVGFGQMVGGKEHRPALVSEFAHHSPKGSTGLHVHGGSRFIEEHDLRVTRNGNGEPDPLGLTSRKAVGPPPQERSDIRASDDLLTGGRPTVQASDQIERLVDADARGESNARSRLQHGADLPAGDGLARITAEDFH